MTENNNKFGEILLEMRRLRGLVAGYLDESLASGVITQKERDVFYYRHIDWNSLKDVGTKFGLTRERIRQIEAKTLEKMRYLEY